MAYVTKNQRESKAPGRVAFPPPPRYIDAEALVITNDACEAMVTLYAIFRKPEEPEVFDKHFDESLVPLLKSIPGLQGFQVTKITGAALGESQFHRVAQLSFNNRRAMDEALASKEGKAVVRNIMGFAADLITVFFGEQII
jgi:uncharacterized protein (TIGR02118 family)